jgi:hypothetical protein
LNGHKSSANKGMTYLIKNKEKEKLVESFVDNKVSCKAMVLRYIPLSSREEDQSSFTIVEEKITKGFKNLTLPTTNHTLTKVSKPLLKGFVHQTELVVTNLEGSKTCTRSPTNIG